MFGYLSKNSGTYEIQKCWNLQFSMRISRMCDFQDDLARIASWKFPVSEFLQPSTNQFREQPLIRIRHRLPRITRFGAVVCAAAQPRDERRIGKRQPDLLRKIFGIAKE